jgi:hypothetical protein
MGANFHVGATNYQVISCMSVWWCHGALIALFAIGLNYNSIKSTVVLPGTDPAGLSLKTKETYAGICANVYIEISF